MIRKEVLIAMETKKPKFLDFYDLDSLKEIFYYSGDTVRVNGKWYYVKKDTKDFFENPKTNLFVKPLRKKIMEVV